MKDKSLLKNLTRDKTKDRSGTEERSEDKKPTKRKKAPEVKEAPKGSEISREKNLFWIELRLVIFLIAAAILFLGKDFYFCDNSLFMNTTDAVPIYTKVKYIVQCGREMQWPSWFPSWYCGSTVSQYYPPLTYILLTPLELLLENTTLCLKIFIFTGTFIGGMGIWALFYRYLGRAFGILAGLLYVTLPYFIISFLYWGTIAQVPVIALAPWYVICCLEFFQKPKKGTWLLLLLLTFTLLISHVMHGFLIAVSVFVPLLVISLLRKKGGTALLLWVLATGLGAGLLSFWWVTGVLPLENPELPSLASEASQGVTANLLWFFPKLELVINKYFPAMANNTHANFPYAVILFSLLSGFFIRHEKNKKKYVLIFLFVLTIFSTIFSFGYHLPFYNYLPLVNNLVPGRILTQAAIGGVILTAYFISKLVFMVLGRKVKKMPATTAQEKLAAAAVIVVTALIIWQCYFEDPEIIATDYLKGVAFPFSDVTEMYSQLDTETPALEKGRLAWFGDFGSMSTYFACTAGYNILYGWNIEGTTMGKELLFQLWAQSTLKNEYVLKTLYDMNVQTCLVMTNTFPELYAFLQENGFKNIATYDNVEILKRPEHSYFAEQTRDCLVIGKSSDLFACDFPWFVKGYSSNPSDYSDDYFEQFDTVYYCEPQIETLSEQRAFEEQLTRLADAGKGVFVEFGRAALPAHVLGVSPIGFVLSGESTEAGSYTLQSGDHLNGSEFVLGLDANTVTGVFGADETLYSLKRDDSEYTVGLVGTKSTEKGQVVFVGGPLTQLKSFASDYLLGVRENAPPLEARDRLLEEIFQELFADLDMNTELALPPFEAQNIQWGANDCAFSYQSDSDKRVTVSVTYAPRWRVYVDGAEIKVDRVDNMLTFNLPAGSHQVEMKYTMTKYGKIGIGMTLFSLLVAALILVFYKRLRLFLKGLLRKASALLQLPALREAQPPARETPPSATESPPEATPARQEPPAKEKPSCQERS